MMTINGQEQYETPAFLTTSLEVANHIAIHLRAMADEYTHLNCEAVKAGKAGDKYVLSGKVGYHETRSYSDVYCQARRESYLVLGHGALGPLSAMRTVDSIRREMLKSLKGSLPKLAIQDKTQTSFVIEMGDGQVSVVSMSDRGRSMIMVSSKLPSEHLRH